MLLGDLDFDPKLYIGEGDPLITRLLSHQTNKDFWDILIAFTSNDSSLNKAIIQYLESRLLSLAAKTSRFKIHNKNTPKAPSLSEMDTDVAEGFLAELLLCLPILGVSLDIPSKNEVSTDNYLHIKNSKGTLAKGVLTDDGFIVFKGSRASLEETPSFPLSLKAKRMELIDRGVLKDSGQGYYEFTCDHSFGSPSTAAGVVQGRSANGRPPPPPAVLIGKTQLAPP
ncbi:GIY-YIG nuclease family protein [Estrella lausannensis]|nr:GIY-YIG nuclease family protein [Estrella lausannensis]